MIPGMDNGDETLVGEEIEEIDAEDDDDVEVIIEIEEVPLSDELEAALEAFVLIEDWDLAVSRAETLDVLVDGLRELEDDDGVEQWIAEYGDRDFHLAQERDGRLVISDVFPVTGVVGFIPKSLVRLIASELAALAEEEQEGWMEALSELSTEWLSLLSDEEKMVGHLIRAHEQPAEETTGDLGALVGQHAALHAAGIDLDEEEAETTDLDPEEEPGED